MSQFEHNGHTQAKESPATLLERLKDKNLDAYRYVVGLIRALTN